MTNETPSGKAGAVHGPTNTPPPGVLTLLRPKRQEETFARLQDFLGVAPEPLRSSLKKAVETPLEALIENYHEVQRALAGTEDEVFLHD